MGREVQEFFLFLLDPEFLLGLLNRCCLLQASNTVVDQMKKLSTYLFRTELVVMSNFLLRKMNGKYAVCVEVSSMELGASDNVRLMLIWGGIYPSDSSCFMPFDSSSDADF